MQKFDRREFLMFLGQATLISQANILSACSTALNNDAVTMGLTPLQPSLNDEILFSKEINFYPLIARKDALNKSGLLFGDNNDYLAFFPDPSAVNEGVLWVNNEYPEVANLMREMGVNYISREVVAKSKKAVGGSLLRIKKNTQEKWELLADHPQNRRIDANTVIPLISPRPINGSMSAKGTLANCAGGVTPWGTVLSCEENYDDFVGEVTFTSTGERVYNNKSEFGWTKYENFIPEHYGWVVEINPWNGQSKKLTAMGRFAHEGATVVLAKDGRSVTYMGDDKEDQYFYKFISKSRNSLETGELFVADTIKGKWLSLNYDSSAELRANFKDQTDILIQCRRAATLLGATPQDRPEGIAIHPTSRDIFISMTNNSAQNRPFGKILRLSETNADPLALTFKASDFVVGSNQSGFACPDNLIFDSKGNLWVTTDTKGSSLGKPPYDRCGGNALFVIPLLGAQAGRPIRVGNAPVGGEFTGPHFLKDGKTMMLSLQHPGEHQNIRSQWSSQVLVLNLPAFL